MEHVLKEFIGSGMISILDNFSGYNKVETVENDKYKATFTTPWETHAYIHIPFGLMNAGVTFQCAMDFSFSYYIFKFILVHQDDITFFFSKNRDDPVTI